MLLEQNLVGKPKNAAYVLLAMPTLKKGKNQFRNTKKKDFV